MGRAQNIAPLRAMNVNVNMNMNEYSRGGDFVGALGGGNVVRGGGAWR